MNKKGQTLGIGLTIITFVTILVGLSLFLVISQEVGDSTSTGTLTNLTIGTQTNGTTYYMTDYRALSSVVMQNATDGVVMVAGNYTLTNNVIDPTTGGLSVSILPTSELFTGEIWNISATAQDTDYIDSSAARTIANLIPLFFALAIALVAMIPTLRSEILSKMS